VFALGRAATRRLNRRELSAALQDVSGLAVDFSYALPDDGKVDGFDTGADGLQDAADSGAQALRRILDDPPPPPPLEVPELIPSDGKNVGKSFKQLLVQHQEDAKCAVCHKSMDPLGFAFQNFDLSGRWREREFEKYIRNELDGKIEWRGSGKERPVDATGKLPRGETFTSFAECKQLLVQHYTDDIVRGWLKNVFLYGTGRKPEIADLAEIRQIMAGQRGRGYPLRELLQAVVRSQAFLGEPRSTKE
jgi:hypothetical protein